MKNTVLSRTLICATPMLVLLGLFAFKGGGQHIAVAQEKSESAIGGHCSNRTLSGDYGCTVQGFLLNIPGLPSQATFVAVTTAHFDGNGNTTSKEHAVVNGIAFNPDGWDTDEGTYSVNPDCTAKATANTPNSPVPLDLFIVIDDNGKEFRQVNNANALLAECRRM